MAACSLNDAERHLDDTIAMMMMVVKVLRPAAITVYKYKIIIKIHENKSCE
jgi:hypothetical protein